ncbi:MAG: IscS subfamily cysteine desulfurase [Candidatus Tectomicrobia bacterium]|nr:IscS subfamily cysteine desulfurase [Candidatus Tectomicrobia bacterium]
MKLPIYMDNHATTPVDPRVMEEMQPYFMTHFGNAASRNHSFGWRAEEAVDRARAQVATLINADPKEIVFTSGATESDNLALKGVAEIYQEKGNHIITSKIEHKAILDSAKALERKGFEVTFLEPDEYGRILPEEVEEHITDKTILISIMLANNEIGTVNPIAAIGKLAKDRGILFHTDAVQGVGKIPVDVQAMNIDLLSLSAHKIYGPKGVGAIYVRRKKPRVRLAPIIDGGGHERGMRSGTLNVPGIVGLGKACEICREEMDREAGRLRTLRDKLHTGITERLEEVHLNGHPTERLPHSLNLSFAYVEGESMLMGLNDIAISSGSACTSATLEPSYVLKGIGRGDELAHSSLRFGLGRFNTEEEVDYTIERVADVVNRLREMSPLYEMAKEGIDLSTIEWGER